MCRAVFMENGMENYLKRDVLILSSFCDAEGKLGIRSIFDLCMDLAAEHAAKLGVSYYDMLAQRCYWVAVRTRIKLYRRPMLMAGIQAETWPGKPGLAKCDRFYRLSGDGEVLAEGRTEWAAQDVDTGVIRRSSSYGYPMELAHREEKLCAEPFTRFKDFEPSGGGAARRYTVGSMDIDLGRHMNNVAYIRMLLGTFTTEEQAAMDVSEVEISYRLGCYEGETLEIDRELREDGWYFQVRKENGEAAVHARLLLRK